jgi:hypothetical protein
MLLLLFVAGEISVYVSLPSKLVSAAFRLCLLGRCLANVHIPSQYLCSGGEEDKRLSYSLIFRPVYLNLFGTTPRNFSSAKLKTRHQLIIFTAYTSLHIGLSSNRYISRQRFVHVSFSPFSNFITSMYFLHHFIYSYTFCFRYVRTDLSYFVRHFPLWIVLEPEDIKRT